MRIRDWSSDVCSSDLSRGDVIVTADAPTEVADQFESTIVWMDEDEMLPGRPYLLKTGTSMVTATITKPKYEVNVNTIVHEAAETLSLNAIVVCNISLDRALPFKAYADTPDQIGRAYVCPPVTNAHIVTRLLLAQKNN